MRRRIFIRFPLSDQEVSSSSSCRLVRIWPFRLGPDGVEARLLHPTLEQAFTDTGPGFPVLGDRLLAGGTSKLVFSNSTQDRLSTATMCREIFSISMIRF